MLFKSYTTLLQAFTLVLAWFSSHKTDESRGSGVVYEWWMVEERYK